MTKSGVKPVVLLRVIYISLKLGCLIKDMSCFNLIVTHCPSIDLLRG